jgi:hypothetical protein
MSTNEKVMLPEDLTRLFVERSNVGDADGVAALYEEEAVIAYPPGRTTLGRAAIRDLWASILAQRPHFEPEDPLPTLVSGFADDRVWRPLFETHGRLLAAQMLQASGDLDEQAVREYRADLRREVVAGDRCVLASARGPRPCRPARWLHRRWGLGRVEAFRRQRGAVRSFTNDSSGRRSNG